MQETIRAVLNKHAIRELPLLKMEQIANDIAVALQNETQTLTCVYCGKIYEPGTPQSNHESLTNHISECTKHPMSKLKKENTAMRTALSGISSALPCTLRDLIGNDLYIEIYGKDEED